MPCVPAAVFLALLIGWAQVEPEHAEAVHGAVLILAVVFVALWSRAVVRASWALLSREHNAPASTAGILRPRIRLSPALLEALDPEALEAARAHEEAHARHRDPLRLWLAQLVTDLQWPAAAPRGRLMAWQHALELARDVEARRCGVPGEDLAAAIIEAARLEKTRTRTSTVALIGNGSQLRERVSRALAPLSALPSPDRNGHWWAATLLILLASAVVLGIYVGEPRVGSLLR